eukprot:2677976-Rhodomonas_salina.1
MHNANLQPDAVATTAMSPTGLPQGEGEPCWDVVEWSLPVGPVGALQGQGGMVVACGACGSPEGTGWNGRCLWGLWRKGRLRWGQWRKGAVEEWSLQVGPVKKR